MTAPLAIHHTHHINGPSRWAMRFACPGSARLEALCPPEADDGNPDASHGTAMHAAVPDPALRESMSMADREQLEWLDGQLAKLQAIHNQPWQFEVHLDIHDGTKWDALLCYGTADALAVAGADAYLADFKFGWIPQDSAIQNAQLAGYALGVFQAYPQVERVHAFLFQPTMRRGVDPYTYTDRDALLDYARNLIGETQAPAPPLQAGAHCAHCRAKAMCSAFRLAQDAVLPEGPAATAPLAPLPLTPDNARAYYDIVKAADALLEQRRKEIVAFVAQQPDQAAIAPDGKGLRLAKTNGDRFVADLAETYAKVKHLLTEAHFLSCCTLHIDRFERLVVQELKRRGDVKTIAEGQAKLAELVTFLRAKPITTIKRV